MRNMKIKYTKILKSYKRNIARKNFKKNILLLFEYIKYKLEIFLENINLPNVLNLFKNKIFLSVLVIAFIILFNLSIFAIKNKSNNNFYFNKKFDNSDKTYKKILSEMNPETNDIIENYLPKIPQITSIANIDGKVSEIFYDYISSDNTLNSDGVIGVKYEEYTIGEGENLTTISRKIGVNLDTLVSVNKITNANKLKPGQKIIIPNRNGLLYTIKQNENIEEVANKYDIQLNRILAFNKIDEISDIEIGDDIFLPGAKYTLDERIEKFGQMFSLPVTVTRISSLFGYRVHPITKVRTKHTGVDIPGSLNTPVYAARKGKVIFAGYSGGYGNLVIVRHDKGYTTYYGHLNKITTKIGANVGVGVMIGRMGSTGNSTGSHLHFEVRRNGEALNPIDFIPIRRFLAKRK
ncbi:M23 family metallopeptidase [Brachyspira aalborgi]|uniref:M23 family metallopeptidase n=1 Tax=Brachyspira aalborgi TaxID=29522 RepID=A0A5C8EDL2_9SPIR|nr:M23 family metallopeptidase [Brachyspira aalborgi]TXJ36167.1 M23 family metallopeptidase [Brachyspira aalborgi]